ncbi:SAM-dependent methyltransferase [Plasticicumulans lactativorans]|nr:class I SAM-dependent methyltransferase [Plasticicumulans lactativorans]
MERGLLPDVVTRAGIRRLLAGRLASEARQQPARAQFVAALAAGPIAIATATANAQHYEVPAAFFAHVLGPHLKYSCAHWPAGVDTLAAAEAAMLALSCARAGLDDGQRILELGCGWGSLTLWMAEHYPRAQIVAVSNAPSQRRYIEARCAARGLRNVQVLTADINDFSLDRRFERVVSVEMFEHLRNHRALLERIGGWLAPGGKLFVHVFSHRCYTYPFEDAGSDDWMARHFFTGGIMPAADLLPGLRGPLQVEQAWSVDGHHYRRTAEAWLARLDAAREPVLALFREVYGAADARRWLHRWRVFFMACAELFGYADGAEWGVSHYRFSR